MRTLLHLTFAVLFFRSVIGEAGYFDHARAPQPPKSFVSALMSLRDPYRIVTIKEISLENAAYMKEFFKSGLKVSDADLLHDAVQADLRDENTSEWPLPILLSCCYLALKYVFKRCRRPFKDRRNATFLLYLFMAPQNWDALVGDLEERYNFIRKKFGARRANFWYWVQVITSLSPIIWAATKKLLKAVSGVAALVQMWRRIRG